MLHDQWRIPLLVNMKLFLLTWGWFLTIELKQHHGVEPNQNTPTWGILCAILCSYLKNDRGEPQRHMGKQSKSKVIICIILRKTIDILEFFIQTTERMIRNTIKTYKIMKIKIEWPQHYLLNPVILSPKDNWQKTSLENPLFSDHMTKDIKRS